MSKALGNPVGRELTLGLYEQQVEKFGRDEVRANIRESATSSEQVQWCQETIWSLRQLGFEIPKNVVPGIPK